MALPSSPRNGAKTIWVALHTAEGARRRQDLYNFFNANQNSSSHAGADGGGFDDWVDRSRAAWTLRNGNPISVNIEMCGFAKWTRAQWLSTGTVDGVVNPRAMVRHAALWAKRECEKLGIPKKYIGVAGVKAKQMGIIIHWDYSKATGDGAHWDIGESFPWDVFFSDMGSAPIIEEDEEVAVDMFEYQPENGLKQYHGWAVETRSMSVVVGECWMSVRGAFQPIRGGTAWCTNDAGTILATFDLTTAKKDVRKAWQLPNGCTGVTAEWESNGPVAVTFVYGKR